MAVIIGGPGVPELVLTASVCTPVRCLGCRLLNIGCERHNFAAVTTGDFFMGRTWHRLLSAPTELRLRVTFENGQCFGWTRQPGDDPVWIGVLGQRVLAVREIESDCLFRCLGELSETETDTATIRDELHDYFQLGTPLAPLVDAWGAADREVPEAPASAPEKENPVPKSRIPPKTPSIPWSSTAAFPDGNAMACTLP